MTSYGFRATTNSNRPYQGYPYVDPVVTDAPSLNPDEVAAQAKWKNLPIKKIISNIKQPEDNPPVIYIDIPEEGGENNVPRQTQSRPAPPVPKSPKASRPRSEDTPVLYIDIPEGSGSEVSQSRVQEEREPEYVQETILYDPFKNRRISISIEGDSDAGSVSPDPSDRRRQPSRAVPPSSLNVGASGGSSGYGGASNPSSIAQSIPPFLSKETYIYSRQPTPDDGFPLSPIPVSDFGKPPPSYEEIDSLPPPVAQLVVEQPRPQVAPPPPTQVIPAANFPGVVGMPHHDRKYVECHHCNTNVHTLVIRENGPLTHFCAWSFMLCCLFPITAIIYCMKYWKYKYHYCPNCNKKIGYQVPMCCTELTYVSE